MATSGNLNRTWGEEVWMAHVFYSLVLFDCKGHAYISYNKINFKRKIDIRGKRVLIFLLGSSFGSCGLSNSQPSRLSMCMCFFGERVALSKLIHSVAHTENDNVCIVHGLPMARGN